MWVFLNTGNAPVPFTLQAKQVYEVGDHPESVVVGDFNGDTHLDLVVANDYNGNLSILLNRGTENSATYF